MNNKKQKLKLLSCYLIVVFFLSINFHLEAKDKALATVQIENVKYTQFKVYIIDDGDFDENENSVKYSEDEFVELIKRVELCKKNKWQITIGEDNKWLNFKPLNQCPQQKDQCVTFEKTPSKVFKFNNIINDIRTLCEHYTSQESYGEILYTKKSLKEEKGTGGIEHYVYGKSINMPNDTNYNWKLFTKFLKNKYNETKTALKLYKESILGYITKNELLNTTFKTDNIKNNELISLILLLNDNFSIKYGENIIKLKKINKKLDKAKSDFNKIKTQEELKKINSWLGKNRSNFEITQKVIDSEITFYNSTSEEIIKLLHEEPNRFWALIKGNYLLIIVVFLILILLIIIYLNRYGLPKNLIYFFRKQPSDVDKGGKNGHEDNNIKAMKEKNKSYETAEIIINFLKPHLNEIKNIKQSTTTGNDEKITRHVNTLINNNTQKALSDAIEQYDGILNNRLNRYLIDKKTVDKNIALKIENKNLSSQYNKMEQDFITLTNANDYNINKLEQSQSKVQEQEKLKENKKNKLEANIKTKSKQFETQLINNRIINNDVKHEILEKIKWAENTPFELDHSQWSNRIAEIYQFTYFSHIYGYFNELEESAMQLCIAINNYLSELEDIEVNFSLYKTKNIKEIKYSATDYEGIYTNLMIEKTDNNIEIVTNHLLKRMMILALHYNQMSSDNIKFNDLVSMRSFTDYKNKVNQLNVGDTTFIVSKLELIKDGKSLEKTKTYVI